MLIKSQNHPDFLKSWVLFNGVLLCIEYFCKSKDFSELLASMDLRPTTSCEQYELEVCSKLLDQELLHVRQGKEAKARAQATYNESTFQTLFTVCILA